MIRVVLAVVVAFVVSGCATYTWHKPDATEQSLVQDNEECRRQSRAIAADWAYWGIATDAMYGGPVWSPWAFHSPFIWPSEPLWRLDLEQQVHDRCMEAKGWKLVKVPRNDAVP